MGNCASSSHAEGKARSDMIDRQIEEDAKKYKRECKILLLGAYATTVLLSAQRGEKSERKAFIRPNGELLSTRVCSDFLMTDVNGRGSSFDVFARHGIIHHLASSPGLLLRSTNSPSSVSGRVRPPPQTPSRPPLFPFASTVSVLTLAISSFHQVPASPESRQSSSK
jgi:hypothetical protein